MSRFDDFTVNSIYYNRIPSARVNATFVYIIDKTNDFITVGFIMGMFRGTTPIKLDMAKVKDISKEQCNDSDYMWKYLKLATDDHKIFNIKNMIRLTFSEKR
jgi:hypothetical protein